MLLRGICYRAGRSAVVALLAAVAVAAAVLVPGFSRAAQQSVLTDRLAAAPAPATGLTVTAAGTAAAAPAAHQPPEAARQAVDAALAGHPALAGALAPAVAGVDTDTVVTGGREPSASERSSEASDAVGVMAARLAYRDRVCAHLTVAGDCPTGPGEVLVSARTADAYRLAPGDRVVVRPAGADTDVELAVVGSYAPVDPTAGYWGRSVYFAHGGFDPASGAPRVDALFTGGPEDVLADPAAVVDLALTYPLRPAAVRLDDLPPLRVDLAGLGAGIGELRAETELAGVLDQVADDRAAIARTVPVLAVPLLLLATFVLFLLVAAVTEERGREIALAKLRGFPPGRTARFGLGEVLALLLVATPVGVVAGLAAVELAARLALAGGTRAELRAPVLVAAAGALAVAALAVLQAARGTLRRPVLELLRRVPARSGWRAGMIEGGLVALAAGALVVALADPAAPLALLAPGLLAVVAGIGTARLVRVASRLRLRRSASRGPGRIGRLLADAQLARRPAGPRVIVVGTVAVGLLSFAAVAWDVAAQARRDHAVDALGADRVYTVHAGHPAELLAAVHAADPSGTAMAVVRASGQYAGEQVPLLAVEVPRLAGVVQWRGYSAAAVAGALRPVEPAPLLVADRIEVTAQVRALGAEPVRLTALVAAAGAAPAAVPLGTLQTGRRGYAAELPACGEGGCRLLGFGLTRIGVTGPVEATLEVTSIHAGAAAAGPGNGAGGGDDAELVELPARFDDPAAWSSGPEAVLTAGPDGLLVRAAAGADAGALAGDVLVEHQDLVPALPVVLAGPAPAEDPEAAEFGFPGLAERPEPFTVVDRATRLPRAGDRGLLLDLEYAVGSAERRVALSDSAGLRYEVWADRDAPADLPQRLAAAGVPVQQTESIDGLVAQLGRGAPALGLWLARLAGAAALALALGVVLLATRLGAADRRAEQAALRVAGVPARTLRRAARREYAQLLGPPLLVGTAVGLASAALLLPGLPLVETGTVDPVPGYRPWTGALPLVLAGTVAGLLLAALPGLRVPAAGDSA